MAKNDTQEIDATEAGDAPLLDLNDASVKKMIARAKKRGIITVDELNQALPPDQMSSEQIEDVMSALNDRGLCESPITFNAIIGWSNALNEGRMQLREILDLEAMLSKGPTAEQIAATEEGGENAESEISEKVAGPSIKEEEEVADQPEADVNEDDEDMVERRTAPQAEEEDDENTLSLAQMEETLKPQALEKFAEITSIFKKFSKVQAHRMEAFQAAHDFPAADEKKYQKLRE